MNVDLLKAFEEHRGVDTVPATELGSGFADFSAGWNAAMKHAKEEVIKLREKNKKEGLDQDFIRG